MEPIIRSHLYLLMGWAIYLGLHSWLATRHTKKYFYSLGVSALAYRGGYNIVAVVVLMAMLFISNNIQTIRFFQNYNWAKITGMMLAGAGVLVVRASFRSYNIRSFLGFEEEDSRLIEEGILAYVRHPIYSGTILIVLGYFFFIPTLATAVSGGGMLLYLAVGILLEERKLIDQFGDQYRDYKKRVPMLIPRRR